MCILLAYRILEIGSICCACCVGPGLLLRRTVCIKLRLMLIMENTHTNTRTTKNPLGIDPQDTGQQKQQQQHTFACWLAHDMSSATYTRSYAHNYKLISLLSGSRARAQMSKRDMYAFEAMGCTAQIKNKQILKRNKRGDDERLHMSINHKSVD